MATTSAVPAELLNPGDIVRLDYRILSTDDAEIAKAVSTIKSQVSADPRWNYQSGRVEWVWDDYSKTGQNMLRILVQVRKTPAAEQPQTQQAGIGLTVAAIVGAIALIVAADKLENIMQFWAAAKVAEANAAIVANPDTSDAVKEAAIKANTTASETAGQSLRASVDSLVKAFSWTPFILGGAILAGMWFSSKQRS